jgi:hypothetical protein
VALATTEQDIALLDAAIARSARSGVQTIEHVDGRRVEYRSLDELLRARERLASMVVPTTPRSRLFRFVGSSGL